MSDCISRAEALEILDDFEDDIECGNWEAAYSKARTNMCELPATAPGINWILGRDRLPEYGRRVLLSYKDDGGVFFGCLQKFWEKVYRDDEVYTNIMRSGWIDDGDEHSFRLDEIEAWAPVPAGYKGGTDEGNMGNDSGK